MEENIQQKILANLFRRRAFGGKHLSFDNVVRSGFASDMRGKVKEEVRNLLREGLIVYYDKGRKALQLNNEKLQEIKRRIEYGSD